MLPALPAWTGLHPLIVHFPIALLLVAPIVVVLSLFMKSHRIGLGASALMLMLLGTVAAFVAVSTGSAAGELAERTAGVAATLERHEQLAETTRTVFALLTGMFAVMYAAPLLRRRQWPNGLYTALTVVFLIFYAGGAMVLVNAAHVGGQLVHQYGVRAMLGPSAMSAPDSKADHDSDN
jgi:uncharacterized membrane protein